MQINEYQERAMGTAVFSRFGTQAISDAAEFAGIELSKAVIFYEKLFGNYPFDLVYTILAMCGECGELANKLKKNLRSGTAINPEELMDENGDVQWYNAATAKVLGFSLEEQSQFNLDKLAARHNKKQVTG